MIFNSLKFLLFFPFVVLFYFILPHKMRWIWLLIASYFFYMCWNVKYSVLLFISTLITYLSGLLIARSEQIENNAMRLFCKKLFVALSFISNLSILFFFKYSNFIVNNIKRALFSLLPIGGGGGNLFV
jgi:D-alanyl-lipoteichoic acid acyltransferase DltB (MBOAT superfamily)